MNQAKANVTSSKARSAHENVGCPHCGGDPETDIVIRCPLCRVAHHLDCYAQQGGCGNFACLGPAGDAGPRSEELLTEEVFLSELRDDIRRFNWRNETVIALVFLALTGLFFLSIALVT